MDFKLPAGAVIRILPPLKSGNSFSHTRTHKIPACPVCDYEDNRLKALMSPKRTLEPCLLPEAAWGKSLCNLNKKGQCKYWPSLRDDAKLHHGTGCIFCDNAAVHGHEVWDYDDKNAVVTLQEVVPVCEMCHHVIHLGRSELLASKGELDFKAVLDHFARVRGVKRFEIEAIAREAFDQWEVRSRRQWKVSYGQFEIYIHAPGGLPDISVFDNMPVVKDKDRLPSQTNHVKWLSVRRGEGRMHDEEKIGTFVVSSKFDVIDLIWPRVAAMTLDGSLGGEAYSSTAQLRETAGLLRDKAVVGVVLGLADDREEIEGLLNTNFGKVATITFKRQ